VSPTAWPLAHPYLSLFGIIFLNRLGLPFPPEPFVLAAGALAGMGRLGLTTSIAIVAMAALLPDWIWYEAGRRRGGTILRFLCRVSLEPDTCVRKTEDLFGRNGARAVLMAKFVPGLGTVAAPMAGIVGMTRIRFSLYSLLSTLSWAAVLEGLGYAFAERLADVTRVLSRFAGGLTAFASLLLALYLLTKVLKRQRFIRSLRIARITPTELMKRLDEKDVVIVDLRHFSELALSPETIPGALRMSPEELDLRHEEIPRGKEVVLVCT
jgi:membrane protein DedA with SNARE-associated domain